MRKVGKVRIVGRKVPSERDQATVQAGYKKDTSTIQVQYKMVVGGGRKCKSAKSAMQKFIEILSHKGTIISQNSQNSHISQNSQCKNLHETVETVEIVG